MSVDSKAHLLWFCNDTQSDWLNKLASLRVIQSEVKPKPNVFPRFVLTNTFLSRVLTGSLETVPCCCAQQKKTY